MRVTVKYFASIRESIGLSGEVVETAALNLGALRDELIAFGGAYAEGLAHGRAVRMALNQVMRDDTAELEEGSEVAFFPPVTGG